MGGCRLGWGRRGNSGFRVVVMKGYRLRRGDYCRCGYARRCRCRRPRRGGTTPGASAPAGTASTCRPPLFRPLIIVGGLLPPCVADDLLLLVRRWEGTVPNSRVAFHRFNVPTKSIQQTAGGLAAAIALGKQQEGQEPCIIGVAIDDTGAVGGSSSSAIRSQLTTIAVLGLSVV